MSQQWRPARRVNNQGDEKCGEILFLNSWRGCQRCGGGFLVLVIVGINIKQPGILYHGSSVGQ